MSPEPPEDDREPVTTNAAAAVAAAYDHLATNYDDTYGDEVSRAEDRQLLRWLRPEIRRAHRVLDVGCGTGWVLDNNVGAFGPGARSYVGFDLSEGMLKRLREKHSALGEAVQTYRGDLNTEYGWPGAYRRVGQQDRRNEFDLVVSTYASPSYADPVDEFLARCRSMLPRGGRVVLVPHAPGNAARTPYLHERPDAYIGDRPWGERDTTRLMERAGFDQVEIRGMRHPVLGPSEHRGRIAHDLWMQVEARLFRPDSMSFLVVTGTAK